MEWFEKAAADFGMRCYFAARRDGEKTWTVHSVTNNPAIEENRFYDSIPIGELGQYEFTVFPFDPWQAKRPYRLLDLRLPQLV